MISIGKDAAKNRLGRELVDEVLAECRVCCYEETHTFHEPASECTSCLRPTDHHAYQPWDVKHA